MQSHCSLPRQKMEYGADWKSPSKQVNHVIILCECGEHDSILSDPTPRDLYRGERVSHSLDVCKEKSRRSLLPGRDGVEMTGSQEMEMDSDGDSEGDPEGDDLRLGCQRHGAVAAGFVRRGQRACLLSLKRSGRM